MSNAVPEQDLDIGFFFPSFVLCLRDFSLEISENSSPDTYFEKCLIEDIKGDKKKTMKYNETRTSILEHFQRRKCFVFDRPTGRNMLHKLEETKESDLSVEFREDTAKFLKYIFSCKPKELMDGSLLNGRMFSILTTRYTESIRNGDLPCIDDTLTIMSIQENQIAVQKAVEMLKQRIKSLGQPLPDDFELKYKQIQRDALRFFRQKSVLDDKQVFQQMAEREMDSFKVQIEKENTTFLQKICFQELQCMYDILIKPKVADGTYFEPGGYKKYREDFEGLRENIKKRLSGVDSNIIQMHGLEFEGRYRHQDEDILEKSNKTALEIKVEVEKKQQKNEKEKEDLLKKEDLKKRSEAEEWKSYKEELSDEREQEKKALQEKYESVIADWQKKKDDLEEKVKKQAEVIKMLRKKRSGILETTKKPPMKETVLKTMFSFIPVVGPIASGIYERYSSS